jgi:hypothetical protein
MRVLKNEKIITTLCHVKHRVENPEPFGKTSIHEDLRTLQGLDPSPNYSGLDKPSAALPSG